jgi:DNA-binding MarR family transcriptional regulator
MNSSINSFRILNAFGLSMHLGELLWDGQFGLVLDAIDKHIYRSAMKQVDGSNTRPRAPAAPDAAASLFTFLDAADQLYGRIAEALARVGLSYAKYEVLKHLRDSDEPVSLGALAEGQRCARSNITQIVDRLEAEGLVRRVNDPNDRRGVRAELTPAGSTQVDEGDTQIDLVRAQFAASFSVSDRAELGRLLAKIL